MDQQPQVFGTNFIIMGDENLEEAEELEDRKRREEELQHLLSRAIGEFNYDDQSTMNSTLNSNDGNSSMVIAQTNLDDQYRLTANAEEQLKILYEVRVREVTTLTKQVEEQQEEFQKHQEALKRKLLLQEIENERKNVSLKEAQELLVEKTQQIRMYEETVEELKISITTLDKNVAELKEENLLLQEGNLKLEQQVVLTERGFTLLNKTMDKDIWETQRNRISELENTLKTTFEQFEAKEGQQNKLLRELKCSLQERDHCLAEKNALINKLTENFDNAQRICQNLTRTVEELSENRKTIGSPLEEELTKIREYKERTDTLCENVRKMVSEQFQEQISSMHSENGLLKETLRLREMELEETRQNMELTQIIKEENQLLMQKIKDLQMQIDSIPNPLTSEKSIETSFLFKNSEEISNLYKEKEDIFDQLLIAQKTIEELEEEVDRSKQENSQLMVKVSLEQERDALIEKLQKQAVQFERMIVEKQNECIKPVTITRGINTDSFEDNNSVLKLKYDALLYQTEANIRKTLTQEFNAKLEKIIKQSSNNELSENCKECNEMKVVNKELSQLRMEDRQAVLKLVQMWTQKFNMLEKQSEESLIFLEKMLTEQFMMYASKLNDKYTDNCRNLSEHLKKSTKELERQKGDLVLSNINRHNLLQDKLKNLATKIQKGSDESTETCPNDHYIRLLLVLAGMV